MSEEPCTTKKNEKIYAFHEHRLSLCKNNHSKTPILYVRFFIDDMVTDLIQNSTELNYVLQKVHQTIPGIIATCAWKNTLSFLFQNLF